jgi:hypothetical protein
MVENIELFVIFRTKYVTDEGAEDCIVKKLTGDYLKS